MNARRVIGALLAVQVSAAAAAPYAPVDRAVRSFVAAPDAEEVGIPAYPGAQIYAGRGPVDPEAKNRTLILYSPDPKDKVLQFYKEKLENWTLQTVEPGGHPLLHEGKEDIDILGSGGGSTRHVLLEDGGPMGRTKITIGYHEVDKPAEQNTDEGESDAKPSE